MGRSQVAYNQKHGRPGGRGGRGQQQQQQQTHRKQQQPRHQGGNAWRFEEHQQPGAVSNDAAAEMESLEHTHIGTIYRMSTQDDDADYLGSSSTILDIRQIGKALSTLSFAQQLRILPYLTAHLETGPGTATERTFETSVETEGTKTELHDTVKSTPASMHEPKDHQAKDQDDDDLDDWLDSVIS